MQRVVERTPEALLSDVRAWRKKLWGDRGGAVALAHEICSRSDRVGTGFLFALLEYAASIERLRDQIEAYEFATSELAGYLGGPRGAANGEETQ